MIFFHEYPSHLSPETISYMGDKTVPIVLNILLGKVSNIKLGEFYRAYPYPHSLDSTRM
jgi:hypothetical protein